MLCYCRRYRSNVSSSERVAESDKDALRFLWKDNLDNTEADTYQMLVHIFGGKDPPCCASYALQCTANDNKDSFSKNAVDDLLKSVESEGEAISLTHELIEMLQRGGFHLAKFISYSKKLLDSLPNV